MSRSPESCSHVRMIFLLFLLLTVIPGFGRTVRSLPSGISGKRLHNYGKSPFVKGKSTISIGPFSMSQTVNVYQAGYNLPKTMWDRRSPKPLSPHC